MKKPAENFKKIVFLFHRIVIGKYVDQGVNVIVHFLVLFISEKYKSTAETNLVA